MPAAPQGGCWHHPTPGVSHAQHRDQPAIAEEINKALGHPIDEVPKHHGGDLEHLDILADLIEAVADVVMDVDCPDWQEGFAENIKWLLPESLDTALATAALVEHEAE